MEPATIALIVGGLAIVLAVLLGILNGLRNTPNGDVPSKNSQCCDSENRMGHQCCDSGSHAAAGAYAATAVRPSVPGQGKCHINNKRGWRAPRGCYFNDADELIDDLGNVIIDMMIIAEMCGITDYVPDEVGTEVAPVELENMPIDLERMRTEPVGTETIASHPEPLAAPTPMPEPVREAFTAPEPAAPVNTDYGSGFGESYGSDDSGGGDD